MGKKSVILDRSMAFYIKPHFVSPSTHWVCLDDVTNLPGLEDCLHCLHFVIWTCIGVSGGGHRTDDEG